MEKAVCVKCPDGKYRNAIFGIGPYIADYPEQCQLASIVQGWCPKYVYLYIFPLPCIITTTNTRCLAEPHNFDNPSLPITPRSMKHTIQLVQILELGSCWDAYGLVGDVVVSSFTIICMIRTDYYPLF